MFNRIASRVRNFLNRKEINERLESLREYETTSRIKVQHSVLLRKPVKRITLDSYDLEPTYSRLRRMLMRN